MFYFYFKGFPYCRMSGNKPLGMFNSAYKVQLNFVPRTYSLYYLFASSKMVHCKSFKLLEGYCEDNSNRLL